MPYLPEQNLLTLKMEAARVLEIPGRTSSTLKPSFEQHPPSKLADLYRGSCVNRKDNSLCLSGVDAFVLYTDKVLGQSDISVEWTTTCCLLRRS